MPQRQPRALLTRLVLGLAGVSLTVAAGVTVLKGSNPFATPAPSRPAGLAYQPRKAADSSGFHTVS